MSEEYYTELIITSQTISPIQISKMLGIQCDECHAKGDLRKRTLIDEKENSWILKSNLSKNISINEHIGELLVRVSPKAGIIGELVNQSDIEVQFSCVIFTSRRPPLSFSKEQVALINKMRANIDIDIYLIPDE